MLPDFPDFPLHSGPLLAWFSNASCQVCKALYPEIRAALVERYPQVSLVWIDVEQQPELSGQFLVMTVPTVILFSEGREMHRQSRFIRKEMLFHTLDRLMPDV